MIRVVEFRLLGPVEVWAAGELIKTSEPRRRAVLAALLVDAGFVVPSATLINRVWGDDASDKARGTLGAHITRIRRVLEKAAGNEAAVAVVSEPGGYRLAVDRAAVDLHLFRRLVGQSHDRGINDQRRVALLRDAIALWRGEPLTGIPGDWASRTREHLIQERLHAIAGWAHAELQVANPSAVLSPLRELAVEHPLVEPLTTALVRALVAVGRPTDALARCRAHRRTLIEHHGTDQGPELRALYQSILREDPALTRPEATDPAVVRAAPRTAPASHLVPVPRLGPVPAQLPAGVAAFAGRTRHLAQLDGLLPAHIDRPSDRHSDRPAATTILTVSGTAGVGKTSLAVRWAHRASHHFPDGQLYVNLRGHDPSGQVMQPTEVIRRFLDALDVPPQRIPTDPDAQAALYRTALAGRRILLVLDNARDTAQVRPLLPGAPTCLVVVTSRNQLTGLVATDGAHPITLELLSYDEGRDLLAMRLGRDRVNADPEAVSEIITRCARLPLALAVVAAHAAIRPDAPLCALAAELADPDRRWRVLTGDDSTSQLQGVFSWSYHVLTPGTARLFRLLGLHPGPDISVPAAAGLAAIAPSEARPLLAELVQASLLTEQTSGRYTLHDLLRGYAAGLAATQDTDALTHDALLRLFDHHLHTADAANHIQNPHRIPNPLPPRSPVAGANPEELVDHAAALAWLTSENPVLLALLRHAAANKLDGYAYQLAWALDTFLFRQCRWNDLAAAWRVVLPGADRLGFPNARATARRFLAYAETLLGHHDDALRHNEEALDLYARIHNSLGQAKVHHNMAFSWQCQDRPEQALDHALRALSFARGTPRPAADTSGPDLEASILNGIACCHNRLGDFTAATTSAEQARALFQLIGDRYGEAAAHDTLGYAQHSLGDYTRAVDCYQRALDLCRHFGEPYDEATVLSHLGDTHLAAGDVAEAHRCWQRAVTILDELRHPDASTVRNKINGLAAGPQVN